MLISSVCLALMSAFVKMVSKDLPTIEIVFFRNILGVLVISLSFVKKPMRHVGGKPWLLFFRGAIGLIAMLSYFYNITHIPLVDAVTYSRTSPLFTALFAFLLLHEKIGFKGLLAMLLGFIGMLLVMQPGGEIHKSYIFGLLNAVCAALAFTSIRELKRYYDTRAIVLSFMGIGLLVPIFSMIVSHFYVSETFDFIMGDFIMPQGIQWFYLAGIGTFASISQIYMTRAYGAANAVIVGATGYSVILFSLLIGLVLGDNLPNIIGIIGIVFIILGGIIIAKEKN
ncbi:DMT family transporter [Sulfurospirillum sp. 1612]|uniref:DMT family transporter n=1 Tax=Sulfurospirillum sp. 1612 TaxID=3094835 RepID=UPI002F95B816